MDNEAPNYASWVPEAGGYVANGKVVSKSPQYDDQGKLKLDVDASLFNQAKPQTANTIQGNNGITTANIAGSGTDANSMMTNIGSGASLNLNTANPDESVLSTPATKSPIAQEPILTPVDRALKNIQDAAGRNDIQGMINGYVELGEAEGKDYSTTIDRLTRQREQKIMNVDDQYLYQYQQAKNAYDMAVRSGDQNAIAQAEANMNNVLAQQQAWREAVGYQDAMQSSYQREEQAQQLKWENQYMVGVNEIANSITQLVGGYLNFQYDPATDTDLLRAQALVEMRARNRMAATGMYYSSTTQFAISQAVAELIPVYEKMAKEEMKEQISMLQSTASFLMNLEQTQFNMWRDQVELQWEANNEKRKEVQAAIDRANARGYYNNEEAALLGVEPGTMSQEARERQQNLMEEIDKENRALEQDKTLAKYKNDLDIQNYEEKQKIASKYTTTNTPNNTNPATRYMGMTPSQWKTYAKDHVANGGDIGEIEEELGNSGFSEAQINSIIEGAKGKETTSIVNEDGTINWEGDTFPGTMTSSKLQEEIEQVAEAGEMTAEDKALRIENAVLNAKSWDEAWNAISTATTESGGAKPNVFDSELIKNLTGSSKDKLLALDEYYTLLAVAEQQGHNVYEDIAAARDRGAITTQLANQFVKAYTKNSLLSDVAFTDDASKNESTVGRAVRDIKNSTPYLSQDQVVTAYERLFDEIIGAGTKNKPFRYGKTYMEENNVLTSKGKNSYDFDAGVSGNAEKCKERAILDVLQDIYNSNEIGDKEKKGYVMKKLTEYLRDKANDELSDGYKFLKDDKYYVLKLD